MRKSLVTANDPEYVEVSDWTVKNPDGHTSHMTYDILKRRHHGEEYSCLTYVRAKLRCWDRLIDLAAPCRDLVASSVILPVDASDIYMSPDALCRAVDSQTDWDGNAHLLAGPTIWFPQLKSQHWAMRQATAFAQAELADRHGVAVFMVVHSPARIAHAADFHIHLLCTARQVTGAGLSTFAYDLVTKGCQTRVKNAWDDWWEANQPA